MSRAMDLGPMRNFCPSRHRVARRFVGFLAAFSVWLAVGEAYLRSFPPQDLHPYLGDAAPGRDRFSSDDRLGVVERDFDSFHASYAERLQPFEPLGDANPHWAMFGNSFVQMKGMLADTARRSRPEGAIFHLGRNEPLHVRVGQIRWLLHAGFRPQRIIFAILPVDAIPLVQHPLSTMHANANGVRTYDAPESFGIRLLLAARVRLTDARPSLKAASKQVAHDLPESAVADFATLFDVLAEESRRADVPVTVLLIPNYEQITAGRSHAFQDRLTALAQARSLDVCDVRDAFRAQPDQSGLFLPDKHFSPRGNDVLYAALLAHLGESPP